ncbi:MAG: hypothetical protein IKK09_02430 [Clostridia bacterium]|nr:hypothetical protein [Clostridia bacterium]
MKLTKKILSLVLAVALVLGSIAVAANAADYDGLTYEGSELAYKIEADKTEVKPGETVTFSVYMKNNYYIGASGGELFLWTRGVFNDIAEADIVAYGIVAKTYNVTPNYAPPTAMYPSSHAYDDWAGYLSSRNANAGTVPEIISDYQLIYEITLTVKEDAVPGTEITFEMPEGSLKSPAQTGRKGTIYQAMAKSVDNAATSIAYSESVDLSAASVTIKVASAVEYCDYAALEAAVAKAPELAEEYYDVDEYAAWEAALAAANELLDAEPLVKEGDNQKTIDDAAALVESTLAALDARYVDLENLTEAVRLCKTPSYAEEYYDAAAYKAWQDAYAAAEKALVDYEGAPATKQGEVNDINNALVDAWNDLVPVFVDLTKLNNAVDAYDELAYGKDYYDADLYAAWEAALADATAAQKTYDGAPATKQAEADKFADDLQAAFTALNPSILDLTALNNAIEASDETEYAAEYYDAAEYAAWEQALADAQAGVAQYTGAANTAANQQAVAALAQALTDAFAALDARFVDTTPITTAIEESVLEYADEYYDAAKLAAFRQAVMYANQIVTSYRTAADTQQNRDVIASYVNNVREAYAALDPRFVSLDELHNAISDYHDPMMEPEWFDANEYAAWEAALDAANEGLTTYEGKADTEENRAAVKKLADDLIAAYRELDPRSVDVSDLEAAIAESVPAYGAEYYDAAAYADFTAAVEAGTAIVDEMGGGAAPDTEANRTTVADAAQAIRNTFAKLAPQFVSYAKLEEAIAAYGEAPEAELYYTPDSWAAYIDAKAAAVEANDNRPEPLPAASEENQAAVDALADALEKAYNELEAAECHVISVTPLQEVYDVNDTINFAVLVEGTAAKIQMIKESGVTSTYDKNTSAAVISVTDNGDGTETWVIARRIYEEKYTEYAKAKVGKVWDTGVTAYSLECTGEDAEVKSVEVTLNGEVVSTVLRSDLPTLTIVTGPAAKKVRLVDPVTRGTITLSTPASVNEDGTKVWTYIKRYNVVKLYDLDVYFVGSDGVSTDSGFDFELNVVEELESQLPSTDKVEDAVLTAAVAKKRIVTGAAQTFTYTTDKAAKAVRIIDANGKILTTIKTATVEGDVATWVYECTYSSIGDRSYTAEVLYGETWLADADSAVSFTVVY